MLRFIPNLAGLFLLLSVSVVAVADVEKELNFLIEYARQE